MLSSNVYFDLAHFEFKESFGKICVKITDDLFELEISILGIWFKLAKFQETMIIQQEIY